MEEEPIVHFGNILVVKFVLFVFWSLTVLVLIHVHYIKCKCTNSYKLVTNLLKCKLVTNCREIVLKEQTNIYSISSEDLEEPL